MASRQGTSSAVSSKPGKHDGLFYPRVVPYTHTTAFLVKPVADVEIVAARDTLVSHDAAHVLRAAVQPQQVLSSAPALSTHARYGTSREAFSRDCVPRSFSNEVQQKSSRDHPPRHHSRQILASSCPPRASHWLGEATTRKVQCTAEKVRHHHRSHHCTDDFDEFTMYRDFEKLPRQGQLFPKHPLPVVPLSSANSGARAARTAIPLSWPTQSQTAVQLSSSGTADFTGFLKKPDESAQLQPRKGHGSNRVNTSMPCDDNRTQERASTSSIILRRARIPPQREHRQPEKVHASTSATQGERQDSATDNTMMSSKALATDATKLQHTKPCHRSIVVMAPPLELLYAQDDPLPSTASAKLERRHREEMAEPLMPAQKVGDSSHSPLLAPPAAALMSLMDQTTVSALTSPSPLTGVTQRHRDGVRATPDDFFVTLSPASPDDSPSVLRGARNVGSGIREKSRSEANSGNTYDNLPRSHASLPMDSKEHLQCLQHSPPPPKSTSSAPGGVSSSSHQRRSLSPPLSAEVPVRGRLSFETAARDDDGEEEAGRRTDDVHCWTPHLTSSFLSPPEKPGSQSDDAETPSRHFEFHQRCHLLSLEEAAAREWLEADASVQLHCLACAKWTCGRMAEPEQCRRRLLELSPREVQMFSSPTSERGEGHEDKSPLLSRFRRGGDATAVTSPPPFLSPWSSPRQRRRMPSVSSLPPLSPRQNAGEATYDQIGEEGYAGQEGIVGADALNSLSPEEDETGRILFSPSYGSSPAPQIQDGAMRTEEPRDDDEGEDEDGRDRIPTYADEALRCTHVRRENNDRNVSTREQDDADVVSREGMQSEEDRGGSDNDYKDLATEGMEDPVEWEVGHDTPTPFEQKSLSPASAIESVEHHAPSNVPRLAPLSLQELVEEEEDSRYLLSGACPPPHVFQRWADRFMRNQPELPNEPPSPQELRTEDGKEDWELERSPEAEKPPEMPLALPAVLSTEFSAVNTAGSSMKRTAGAAVEEDRTSVHRPSCDGSSVPLMKSPQEASASAGRSERFSQGSGRSTSRQRQCSERHHAWVLQSLLEAEDAASERDALYAAPQDRRSPESLAALQRQPQTEREYYSATGRYAPDPQIFTDENMLTGDGYGGCSGKERELSLPGNESDAHPRTGDERTRTEARQETTAAATTITASHSLPATSTSTVLLTYPSEETYMAPLGSERDGWQMLMDAFIEGLLQLMEA